MPEGNLKRVGSGQARSSVLPTQFLQYGVPLLSVALALGITLSLRYYLAPTPTPLFFVAVMVSAWYGGVKSGLAATFLSTLAINYFLLEPLYKFNVPNLGTVVRLGVFVMAALLISSLNEAQRTARRKAEANFKSLQESEIRFGCLAESNIIGMLVAELDGAILDANHNFLQLIGYTQEELRAGQLHWRRLTPPESCEISEKAVRELLSTGSCTPFEKEYIRKDGSRVSVLHGAVMTGNSTVTGFVLDLSERKRVEAIQQEAMHRERSLYAEVQAANAQLENVLASLNDQFLVLDSEWRYIYVSDRVVKTVGKPREDLLGRCIWEVFPETVDSNFYREIHRAVAEQTIVQFEYFYAPWQRWFENRIYPSTTGVSVLVTDITERKQAEEALRQSEERYRAIYDQVLIGISQADLTGKIIQANERFCEMVGRSLEELLTLRMQDITHPDDLPHNIVLFRQMLENGSSFEIEKRYVRPDGSVIWVRNYVSLIRDQDGHPKCGVAVTEDITERQQAEAALRDSEERLRLALMATNQGLYDLNVQTGDAIVSPAYAVMLGYDPDEFQETNAKWRDRLHPDDVEVVYQVYEDYIAGKLNIYRVEFRQRTKSGNWKWILSIGKIVAWDSQGQPLRMLGTHTDITDRKQAEREREQLLAREKAAREEAETANRIKDEFLAVLSHELRSPLNPILGWSKLLQTKKLDEQKTQQALATIERNAKLQTQLIEDLLDVSRILRGKLALNIAPVSLISTIEAAIETVRLAVEAKEIHIQKTFELDSDQVMGDAARLQQVIWNLLTNAVKFTPSGGTVDIHLSLITSHVSQVEGKPTSQQNQPKIYQSVHTTRYAQIQVKDTGKGITPEFLPYVFDYFRQEDGTTTRKFGGLGLGLAIVRHITELHGGTVQAESPGEGQGATFTVRLPLLKANNRNQNAAQNIHSSAPCPLPLQNVQILAVDDDDDIRALIEFVLAQAGANVRVVASATEALQQLETFSPEILISDIGMPDFDGYMLMRQVRSLSSKYKLLPAIALTAYAGESDQQQAIAAGFQMHIAKPVEPEKLIHAVTLLLNP